MKHTKGKWRVTKNNEFIGNGDEPVCVIWDRDSETSKSNAKLISKAPEMYEALMMAMSCIINHGSKELIQKYESLLKEIES